MECDMSESEGAVSGEVSPAFMTQFGIPEEDKGFSQALIGIRQIAAQSNQALADSNAMTSSPMGAPARNVLASSSSQALTTFVETGMGAFAITPGSFFGRLTQPSTPASVDQALRSAASEALALLKFDRAGDVFSLKFSPDAVVPALETLRKALEE